jgi:carbamoyltransferase
VNVVGISAHFHDAACCLVQDGRLVAAAQEERFTRVKHDPSIPREAFRYCLRAGGTTIDRVDCVAYYESPRKKLERQLWMGLPQVPLSTPEALFRLDASRPEREIRELLGYDGPIEFVEHHEAHAASAYHWSGYPDAAILTVDAVGEWTTTAYGHGSGGELRLFEEVAFPHSLGLLYSAITSYLGFAVNDAEYKVMGLAPYGTARHADAIRGLVATDGRGGIGLDLDYFDFSGAPRMYTERLCELLGRPPRVPESELNEFHSDVAASVQSVLEEVLLEKVRYLHERAPSESLCMAGGVALNCVANGRIRREGPFARMFVQPAASDAGGALGAAAMAWLRRSGGGALEPMRHAHLGPAYGADAIAELFDADVAEVADHRGREEELLDDVAGRLARGEVVGWFHGAMEFGPRALGARSILADPRLQHMRDHVNAAVKKREAFRPFAPAVLAERASDHFDLDGPSPYMLETCQVRSELDLPAITHVDGSARPQTVDAERNPRFHRLLERFERLTGCPVLLNTSLNLRGEPIACTPVDAISCFVRSGMDCIVLEDLVLDRAGTPPAWEQALSGAAPADPALSETVYAML